LIALAVVGALTASAVAQVAPGGPSSPDPPEARAAATASLDTFRQLASPNAKEFSNAPGAAPLDVGRPVADYIIGLDKLVGWNGDDDPAKLLQATGRMIYPIETNGVTWSSVIMSKKNGKWQADEFSGSSEAQLRATTQAKILPRGRWDIKTSSRYGCLQ